VKIVLDTNVLVSGLLSPHGPPGQIVQWVAEGICKLCVDARILAEYRDVLLRPEFGFDPERVQELLVQIEADGDLVACLPWRTPLADPDDEKFLEATGSGAAECLVTGNLRHYPAAARHGLRVLTPAQFVQRMRREV
jgi:uncharacterized protein